METLQDFASDAMCEPSQTGILGLLIVADVRLYRDGLQLGLATRPHLSVLGTASQADEALRLIQHTSPDVVVVDMASRDSLAIVRAIRRDAPGVLVIGFGVDEVASEILACAEAGMAGYVPCDASLDDLVERIECVRRGELICSPKIAATLFRTLADEAVGIRSTPKGALSSREREVLPLIDRGYSNKEIATHLGVEVSTVKHHVHSLLTKLNCKTRAEVAARLGARVSPRVRQTLTGLAAGRD